MLRADGEGAGSEHGAVFGVGAGAVAGPDVPVVDAGGEAVLRLCVCPVRLEGEGRFDGPGAEDFGLAAEELDVVVAGVWYRGPGEAWRFGQFGAVLGCAEGGSFRCGDDGDACGAVAGLVEGDDDVAVVGAVLDFVVDEGGRCAAVDDRCACAGAGGAGDGDGGEVGCGRFLPGEGDDAVAGCGEE